MNLISLAAGSLRLVVDPALGAGIADFSVLGPSGVYYPMMRRASPGETNASLLGSFMMAPWVNRIAGASFVFRGQRVTLAPNTKDGMAQHGDVRKRAWRVDDVSATGARLSFESRRHSDSNWPWAYGCSVSYALSERGLSIDLDVMNLDTTAFPAGCGHHPYFSRRLFNDLDTLHFKAPVGGRYPLARGCATGAPVPDELCASVSELRPIPDSPVDDVFAGFGGQAELRWDKSGVGLVMTASANMGHLVVFAPHARGEKGGERGEGSPLPFVAVEPQTQVNDALNLEATGQDGTGTVVLEPGQTLQTSVRFEVVGP